MIKLSKPQIHMQYINWIYRQRNIKVLKHYQIEFYVKCASVIDITRTF